MEIKELYDHYPVLYHMAWRNSWSTIEQHGLLSTLELLNLYQVKSDEKKLISQTHRPECVKISNVKLPDVIIRDQKPMSDAGVIKALQGTAKPADWYNLLNSMVFFWPTKKRLKTMLSAKAYRDLDHDVLIVRTKELVTAHANKLRISPINSGCTTPWAHPRSLELFKTAANYPFEERKKKNGVSKAIAEICFVGGIPDIKAYVEDVLVLNAQNIDTAIKT